MTTARAATTTAPPFGRLLKQWRTHRRLSQLELALVSDISQRHISFLETGRANPSRNMVLTLSHALRVPLRERNALLQTAGFAAAYSDQDLDDDTLAVYQGALEKLLRHHEPFPAFVVDGRWNLRMQNQAAILFFSRFFDLEQLAAHQDFQIVRICMSDNGLRPYVANWHELMQALLQRCRRALLDNPMDLTLQALIDEILEHRDALPVWRCPDWSTPPSPVVPMTIRDGDAVWNTFTMLAHFGNPQHVTLEELALETLYPADEKTERQFTELAATVH